MLDRAGDPIRPRRSALQKRVTIAHSQTYSRLPPVLLLAFRARFWSFLRMAPSISSSLQFNSRTGEPFIRLASPHDNLILTPPRPSDADAVHAMMTDPKVYKTLEGPPFPYLESHATSWLDMVTSQSADAMRELQAAEAAERADGMQRLVGSCPVHYIREVRADGSDVLLGDIAVHRCQYPDVQNPAEKARLTRENAARELGDPDLAWCIGSKQARHVSRADRAPDACPRQIASRASTTGRASCPQRSRC